MVGVTAAATVAPAMPPPRPITGAGWLPDSDGMDSIRTVT